jgi:hypothetical protein
MIEPGTIQAIGIAVACITSAVLGNTVKPIVTLIKTQDKKEESSTFITLERYMNDKQKESVERQLERSEFFEVFLKIENYKEDKRETKEAFKQLNDDLKEIKKAQSDLIPNIISIQKDMEFIKKSVENIPKRSNERISRNEICYRIRRTN